MDDNIVGSPFNLLKYDFTCEGGTLENCADFRDVLTLLEDCANGMESGLHYLDHWASRSIFLEKYRQTLDKLNTIIYSKRK